MKIVLPVIETAGGNGYRITLLSDGSIFIRSLILFHDDIDPIERDAIIYNDANDFLERIEIEHDSEIVIKKVKEMVSIWKSVFDKMGE